MRHRKENTVILAIALTLFLSTPLNAATHCQWTVQGTDANFASEALYKQNPQIDRASCTAGENPNCIGYAYCKESEGKIPPQVIPLACAAIQVNGKYRCPDAHTCLADEDVVIAPMKNAPSFSPAPSAQSTAPGARSVREGNPQ